MMESAGARLDKAGFTPLTVITIVLSLDHGGTEGGQLGHLAWACNSERHTLSRSRIEASETKTDPTGVMDSKENE